jgi:hypothetical protein
VTDLNIRPLLHDSIYAARGGGRTLTGLRVEDEQVFRRLIERLLAPDGRRVFSHITEVTGFTRDDVQTRDVFTFAVDQTLPGHGICGHVAAGSAPALVPFFRQRGVALDDRMFTQD